MKPHKIFFLQKAALSTVCITLHSMTKPAQEKFYQLLGNKIRDARKAAGFKQEAFASYLELSRASVVNIEKGRQHPPLHLISDIAKILNVELCSLIPEQPSQDTKTKTSW